MSITSCTTNSITPTPQSEIISIQDKTSDIRNHIDPKFLTKCKWVSPLKGKKQSDLAEASITSVLNAKECYILHNSFVDWFNETNKFKSK